MAFLKIIDYDIGHVISGEDPDIFPFFECQKTIAPKCKESRSRNMVNIRINDLFTINFKRYNALTYWFLQGYSAFLRLLTFAGCHW